MILALVHKELHHHYQTFFGLTVLFVGAIAISLSSVIGTEQGTLLAGATGLAWWGVPIVIAVVVRRLVVLEYEQGTYDFLAALPGHALVRVLVKYVLGWVFVQALALAALVLVAMLVSGQELVSLGFLFQVAVQIVAYVAAWYGLTFFAAHLGRYRYAFWLLLLPTVLTLGFMEPDVYELYLWQAALVRPIDETRTVVPWSGLALSTGWAILFTLGALFLAGMKQGARSAAWFRLMSAREKTMLVVVVFAALLGMDIVDEMPLFGGPVYSRAPAVGDGSAVVRVTVARDSKLWGAGVRLARELDGLAVVLGGRWPVVVLVPVLQEAERSVDVRSQEFGELVLEVDLAEDEETMVREALAWVLADRASTYNRRRANRSLVALGAPRWWLSGPEDGAFAVRAALASTRIRSADDLRDGLALEDRLGTDLAAAVGWAGLRALEHQAGRDAVLELFADLLGPDLEPDLAGAMWVDSIGGDALVQRVSGVSPEAFRELWLKELRDLEVRNQQALDELPALVGTLRRDTGDEANVVLVSELDDWPVEGLEVAWLELDPLHTRPMPMATWETRVLDEPLQRVPTPVDPRARLAMRYHLHIDALAGTVAYGLVVDPLIALIAKELDGVRPYWYAVAAMCLWFAVSHLMEPIGQQGLSVVATDGVDAWGIVCGMLAFSLGHSLPSAEYRHGHIEFLDGLPVSRAAVYLAKVLAAALPLVVLVVGSGLIKWAACELGGAPAGLPVGPAVWAQVARLAAMCTGFAGLGLLLSWLGGLGWGVLLIGLFGLMMLTLPFRALRAYGFFEGMLVLDWDGSDPISAWGPVIAWSTVGVLSTVLSGVLFLGPGRFVMTNRTFSGGAIRVVAIGCGSAFFLLIAGLSSLVIAFEYGGRFLTTTDVHQTEYFTFLYPSSREAEAMVLMSRADEIDRELARTIGSDGPVELEIELLGASSAHAGVFLGGKIRMGLENGRDTLTHELAHAHAYALMGGEMTRHFDKTRFFQEGFASYYENMLSDSAGGWQWAAAVHKTGQSRFDLLVEDERRRVDHDPDQAYPLGEVFVHALVDEHGDRAPACVQRQLGGIGSRKVAGMSLWFAVMEGCGYSLDRVVARYDALLSEAAEELPELPDLTARVDLEAAVRRLHVHDANDQGARLVCRFRDKSDDSRNQYKQTEVWENGTCRIGAEIVSGGSFQYQLGFYIEGSEFPVYLEWTTAPL